ncbi:MAG: response regulator transcription factor [Sphingomonadaceae bacterium]
MKNSVFALDDDPQWLQAIEDAVLGSDIALERFTRFADFKRHIRRASPDLIVLDWNLGDVTGLDVLQWLRNDLSSPVPVIMLTSRDAETHIVTALETGADDYVTKPVALPVLRARLRALLRRAQQQTEPAGQEIYGDVKFDCETRTVEREVPVKRLSNREFDLALLLFRNIGSPIARDTIYTKIWGNEPSVQSRTLDSHITALRRKLNLRPEYGYMLSTIYGFGYRLEQLDKS